MQINRLLKDTIIKSVFNGKVVLILGARQVGKTTLLHEIRQKLNVPSNWLNADEADILRDLSNANTSTSLLNVIGHDRKLVIIDEAQQVPNIGKKLKLIHDTFPHIQVIVTGSSTFQLMDQSSEPLTGRKRELQLFPISFGELVKTTSLLEEKRSLHHRLIYGSYPEIINHPGQEKAILIELANSYLYNDVLRLEGIRKASLIQKLLQAIAMQIGSEVRYHELARNIGNIDPTTVEKYLDILEKAFVIYKLPGFSRNMRTEIKKGKKYYFYDNGVRNVLINNFNSIDLRPDVGALWENYLLSERLKHNSYSGHYVNAYFWRTTDQAEIDYIEEIDGQLNAYEFKWKQQHVRFPLSFKQAYTDHTTAVINIENYGDFLGQGYENRT